jgi:acetyltransferase-like isoleucine patch superfamily enzyme
MNKILLRIIFLPVALFRAIGKLANDSARDIVNRKRYPQSIIDDGVCMTQDTELGNKSHILKGSIINHSKIGNYTYICRNALIQNTTIGNYCSISHEFISGLGSHPTDLFSTSPLFYRKQNTFNIEIVEKNSDFQEYKPIEIGNDVWIGARVTVMDGVKIGTGAIVATGSIVTKDVPPYAIVGGVPAKVIKYRLPEDRIAFLEQSEWWNLSPQEAYKKMDK